MELISERLILRPIQEDDTEDILRWRNSDRIREHFIFRDELTREMHLAWLKNQVATGRVVQFIIVEKETMQSVGTIYIRDIDKVYRKGEYGIYIGEASAAGKGYGLEASQLLQQYAFGPLNLHRLYARVISSNSFATNRHSKAGFEYEGTFRDDIFVDGMFHDVIYMSIINPNER